MESRAARASYLGAIVGVRATRPQALWKLLGTPGDDREVVMIYGNRSPNDILMKERLDEWAKARRDPAEIPPRSAADARTR